MQKLRPSRVGTPPKLPATPEDRKADVASNNVVSKTNLIRNGLFNYPFSSPESGWGNGLYSDRFSDGGFLRQKQYWLNFAGANIEASIVATQKGDALEIVK